MIIFTKAIIRGGAAGDLFAVPVMVDSHRRKDGAYVPAHPSIRYKRRDPPKPAAPAHAAPQLSLFEHQPPAPEPAKPAPEPPPPAPETEGADTFTIVPIQDPPAEQPVDESAGNSGSVAEAPAQPEPEEPQQPAIESSTTPPRFDTFDAAVASIMGAPFTAEELAARWTGRYADDVLDQLHARPDDFAMLIDGRWQEIGAYLKQDDRAGEVSRLADAVTAEHPEAHRERWRGQIRRLADRLATEPKARALTAAPEPDDMDPSSPNYRYRDTGYIAGSRKEMATESIRSAAKAGRRVRKTDVDWDELEQNPRQATDLITKANLFGDVDWQAMQAAGTDPAAGFLISRVYAAVGAQPDEQTPQRRQDYATALDSLRDRLDGARSVDDVTRVLEEIGRERDGITLTAAETEAYAALNAAVKRESDAIRQMDMHAEGLSREASSVENRASTLRYELDGRRRRKWKVTEQQEAELARLVAEGAALRQTAVEYRRAHGMTPITHQTKDAGGISARFEYPYRANWEKVSKLRRSFMEGVVARNRAENPLTRAWHTLGKGFQAVLDYRSPRGSETFAKHVAAAKAGRPKDWDWAERKREVAGASKRSTAFQLEVADSHERRGGRPVTVETTKALKEAFGLRDVQSGHWVLEDPNSAKFHTEAAAAAFADLADLIGAEDHQVSLKGRLGLAFGARGAGRRTGKAHYEPIQRVINITKMAGGGSLGHEWFHFLDNLIPEVETSRQGAADHWATEGAAHDAPDPVRRAFEDLTTSMMAGPHRAMERMAYTAADARWADHNMASYQNAGGARAVIRNAPTMQDAVDGIQQMMAAGGFGPPAKPKTKNRAEEWRKMALIWHAERERKAAGVPEDAPRVAEFARGRGTSAFVQAANELDDGAAGKYWSQPKELAARAFSAWIEDRLEQQGRRNTYLAADANNDHPAYRLQGVRPFPAGEERTRINEAFDRLFAVLRESGTLAKALAAMAA